MKIQLWLSTVVALASGPIHAEFYVSYPPISPVSIASITPARHVVVNVVDENGFNQAWVLDSTANRWTAFPMPQAQAVTTAGTAVVIAGGGAEFDAQSWLEVREIGDDATPTFVSSATLHYPVAAGQPYSSTGSIAAMRSASGATRIWQTRMQSSYRAPHTLCAKATLHRVDQDGANMVERYALDLMSDSGLACMYAKAIALDQVRPGDPADAQAMIVGGSCRSTVEASEQVCTMRVIDAGGRLTIDPRYANGPNGSGLGLLDFGHSSDVVLTGLLLDANGNILLTANRAGATGLLARLQPDGTLDATFGDGGTVAMPSSMGSSEASGITLMPNGRIQVFGASVALPIDPGGGFMRYSAALYVDAATGGGALARTRMALGPAWFDLDAAAVLPDGDVLYAGRWFDFDSEFTWVLRVAGRTDVVEYYNEGFGHYFISSKPEEIAALDNGIFADWKRTGEVFAAFKEGVSDSIDVCRYFSRDFAPKSTHVYAVSPAECEWLSTNSLSWAHEDDTFGLQPVRDDGSCLAGARPLFRLYNNGQGGAPNHRYTISEAILAEQGAKGWVAEGRGSPAVFACVPM